MKVFVLEDQFTSPCSSPRTLSPCLCPCPQTTSPCPWTTKSWKIVKYFAFWKQSVMHDHVVHKFGYCHCAGGYDKEWLTYWIPISNAEINVICSLTYSAKFWHYSLFNSDLSPWNSGPILINGPQVLVLGPQVIVLDNITPWLVGWLSGRTSVSDWRTFTGLHLMGNHLYG